MNTFVGVDISKDTFNIAVLKDENFILSQTFPMSQEGFSQFLSLLNQLTNPIVAMESTGRFFLPLYHFLLANDIQAFIINPKILHRFSQFISANNPSKSDTKDAKILALFAQSNPQFLNPLPPDHHLRNLSRLIQKLKKE
uniref:IS110 family transposase n=1 Tax=Thermodesulfobacterium commune TaxID=1741 RepID=UPI001F4351A8|nr:IS110 family transposase [Thermodesulfobacterium commune]